jgi:hypothetical protein
MDPRKLHRIHAAPISGVGGCSLDIGPTRWRGEGGSMDERRAQSFRLSLAWNLLEGMPTDAAESGAIRDYYEAVDALLVAIGTDPAYQDAVARVRDAWDRHDMDVTGGRLHDCESCLAEEAEACGNPDEGSPSDARAPAPRAQTADSRQRSLF